MGGYAESAGPALAKEAAIARVCHEVNRAICLAAGDESQPAWEDAPEWQVKSAIEGVQFVLNNPDSTPAEQHAAWCRAKIADGWIWGPVKMPETKVHPCLTAYEFLPFGQRVKDHVFRAVVKSLAS